MAASPALAQSAALRMGVRAREASIYQSIHPSASLARLAPLQWSARTPRPWPAGPDGRQDVGMYRRVHALLARRAPIPPRPPWKLLERGGGSNQWETRGEGSKHATANIHEMSETTIEGTRPHASAR